MAVKRPSGGTNTDIQLILSEKENLKIAGKESQLKYTKNGKFSINSNVEQKLDDGEDTYNQLIVPAGKRSSIIFSDGTRMDVNANTRVVYPVVFSHNKREIYVEGEVYLQVSPDKSRPFIVRTDRMDVQVLGTAFDVCTNPDRTLSTVVLVHAKGVRLYLSGNNLFCFSKFKLWDPELGSGDGLRYPPMRSLLMGIDVNF